MGIDYQAPVNELPVGCVKSHFLDSGAFSQWAASKAYGEKHGCDRFEYFDTEEFWNYIRAYAEFIIKHKVAIDLYANLDVIGHPKLTFRNQKFLEDCYNLNPVPVVHYRSKNSLDWLRFYIKRGHKMIGLGGMVGSSDQLYCRTWIDQVFEIVCNTPDGLPKVRIHGFGITTHQLLVKYPWWSVDSAAWTKVASFGGIIVPRTKNGEWNFLKPPYIIKVSEDSPDRKRHDKHMLTFSPMKKDRIKAWLKEIGVPMGEQDHYGDVIKWGVTTHHTYRKIANLLFYERMRKFLPKYPWPFHSTRIKGFLE